MHQGSARGTSWQKVASWYDEYLADASNYHSAVIIPGALRLLGLRRGDTLLDIACGEGGFAREAAATGARVMGVDAAPALIARAKERARQGTFLVDDARKLATQAPGHFSHASMILALQNVDDAAAVFRSAARILQAKGVFLVVLTHPCFRVPRQSGWGWDEGRKLQYRRVDSYLGELKVPIQTHPGKQPSSTTWTFHRPLQHYIQQAAAAGMGLVNLEEWVSHKESKPGGRAKAENRARQEIPLFMALLFQKIN